MGYNPCGFRHSAGNSFAAIRLSALSRPPAQGAAARRSSRSSPNGDSPGHWAQALAQALPSQDLERQAFIVTLRGDLGAGKTTLVRYLLRALGVQGRIKSPTFALVESYNLPKFPVYHFDLYRFSTPDQWFDAGFDDIFAGAGLMLVEWPEQAAGALPAADLDLRLLLPDPDTDETPRALLARDDTRGDVAAWTDIVEMAPDPAEARHLEAHAHSARGTQCLTKLANILAVDDAC